MSEVLACVDFSDATDAVAREGARLAHTADNRLHLIHVAADEPELAGYDKGPVAVHTRADRADHLLTEHESMQELADRLRVDETYPDLQVIPVMAMGPTVAKILDEAEHIDAGVVVVGSHGHGGLHHLLLGSVSEGLIKHSPRPVVVVPVGQR